MKKVKLCKDCKYYDYDGCNHPKNLELDVTNGNMIRIWNYCSNLRKDNLLWSILIDTCGIRARWFEPKKIKMKCKEVK